MFNLKTKKTNPVEPIPIKDDDVLVITDIKYFLGAEPLELKYNKEKHTFEAALKMPFMDAYNFMTEIKYIFSIDAEIAKKQYHLVLDGAITTKEEYLSNKYKIGIDSVDQTSLSEVERQQLSIFMIKQWENFAKTNNK